MSTLDIRHYLEESVLRVEPHDGVVVEVLGQGQLVDLERALELAHHAPVVLELLLGLLPAVQVERLQPLREALELPLRLQLVREHLWVHRWTLIVQCDCGHFAKNLLKQYVTISESKINDIMY